MSRGIAKAKLNKRFHKPEDDFVSRVLGLEIETKLFRKKEVKR